MTHQVLYFFKLASAYIFSLGQHTITLTNSPHLDATLPTDANDLAHPIDTQNLFRGTIPCFYACDGILETAEIPETSDAIVRACQDLRCARGGYWGLVGIDGERRRSDAGIDQTGRCSGVHERPGRTRK